jgi:Protein of unknown function (DUF3987)
MPDPEYHVIDDALHRATFPGTPGGNDTSVLEFSHFRLMPNGQIEAECHALMGGQTANRLRIRVLNGGEVFSFCQGAVNNNSSVDWHVRFAWAREQLLQEIRKVQAAPDGTVDEPPVGPMPSLPAEAQVDEQAACLASPWLDDYTAWSKTWAPRAFDEFHEASGLFGLSTVAARRIKIDFGFTGVYTAIYQAFVARTTLFTKSTTADLIIAMIKQAGLNHLFAPHNATPQAFHQMLSGHVPERFAGCSQAEQIAIEQQLAFAAQKGWFYEEFGEHLDATMRANGHMQDFRSLLRAIDDHKDEHTYITISRGEEIVEKPYLALLALMTPADLKPFATRNGRLWRDGYLARFAFVCPPEDEIGEARFPDTSPTVPFNLLERIAKWHKRLGIPTAHVNVIPATKKSPVRYTVQRQPLPETVYTMTPAVTEAFYRYDIALRRMTIGMGHQDLDGNYGRLANKALRVAGLLASLEDERGTHTIQLPSWYRGQSIAERWRASLHRLIGQVQSGTEDTREAQAEEAIIKNVRTYGASTVRDIARRTHIPTVDVNRHVTALVQSGALKEETTARTTRYTWWSDKS